MGVPFVNTVMKLSGGHAIANRWLFSRSNICGLPITRLKRKFA